ncbi:unnamed protein product, partial [Rotaria sp. Silwood1]
TNLQTDCNMKIETPNNHHTTAITRAFDNLAKAAAHVIIFFSCETQTKRSVAV